MQIAANFDLANNIIKQANRFVSGLSCGANLIRFTNCIDLIDVRCAIKAQDQTFSQILNQFSLKMFVRPLFFSESKKRRKDPSESTEEDGAPECKGE